MLRPDKFQTKNGAKARGTVGITLNDTFQSKNSTKTRGTAGIQLKDKFQTKNNTTASKWVYK